LIGQILTEEKNEAKAKKRELEPWAAKLVASGAANEQAYVDKLFMQLDTGKKGVVDLTQFIEQLKLRPSRSEGGAKSKKKKKGAPAGGGPAAYVLTTVKADNVRDWVSETLLRNWS